MAWLASSRRRASSLPLNASQSQVPHHTRNYQSLSIRRHQKALLERNCLVVIHGPSPIRTTHTLLHHVPAAQRVAICLLLQTQTKRS